MYGDTAAGRRRVAQLREQAGDVRALAARLVSQAEAVPWHGKAADAMREALAKVELRAPVVPVMANVGAAPLSDPDAIRASLVAQVTGTVRWRECVLALADAGVTRFVEVGSGKVLAGLVKRIAAGATTISIGTADDIKSYGTPNG